MAEDLKPFLNTQFLGVMPKCFGFPENRRQAIERSGARNNFTSCGN
jgi:hypothetical protein